MSAVMRRGWPPAIEIEPEELMDAEEEVTLAAFADFLVTKLLVSPKTLYEHLHKNTTAAMDRAMTSDAKYLLEEAFEMCSKFPLRTNNV